MKFLVDELPYYGDGCLFERFDICPDEEDRELCPRYWSKYKVCEEYNEKNPHECHFLKEIEGCDV